jgi:ABC-2 type transport system permease protein
VKIILPPALEAPPPPQSFLRDFMLLTKNQMRVSWNKWRHLPKKNLILMGFLLVWLLIFLIYLGSLAYGAIGSVPFELGQGLLSLLFMSGLVAQIFFGLTAAFTTLYMSEDLELLFMAPVSVKAVFAVKSLSVFASNLATAVLFVLLPGVFYGLLFQAEGFFYLTVVLVTLGLLTIGTALAELLNLFVMRIVPPHRSKEAVGFIGAVAGIVIVLMIQLPNMVMGREEQFDIGAWLLGNAEMLKVMGFFPWGWASKALVAAISGNVLSGLGWCLLLFLLGILLFSLAFSFVERGFRRGFISLSQGGRHETKGKGKELAEVKTSQQIVSQLLENMSNVKASALTGIWAVAKKDLLYLKRDTREWFGYLVPLIIMAFFIVQYLLSGSEGSRTSVVAVLIMYTVMFSGNMALQSFGREGESDWLLNSVPLAGWPVVLGKLLASVLPTLVLMEALLIGTGVAIDLSFSVLLAFAIGAILLSLGSSAIGLFYSINNSRYNPESPQQRIAPGASMIMYLINLVFILFLTVGSIYIFRPAELIAFLEQLPSVTYEGGFLSAIIFGLYLLSRPLLWPAWAGVLTGILVTGVVWSGMFFGFMAATVRQSRKGFRVELVAGKKKKNR